MAPIMKRQSSVADLVAAPYNGKFTRSHQQTDSDQAVGRSCAWSLTGSPKPQLKWDLAQKPCRNDFRRARPNVGFHRAIKIASVVCYGRLHIARGAHLARYVRNQ